MSDLQARFVEAQQAANNLSDRPDNNTMLKLYALFKQATQGDVKGERPGSFDFIRRAKFDAWIAVQGTPSDEATRQYIDLVDSLQRAELNR
jgi:diazepam-binding inhibitor (GABA receptor modulator, acyl-CoA-binding protein)